MRSQRQINRPLLKYYNALTTNTRMVVLYGSLLAGQVAVFFAFELIVLNLLMVALWAWIQPAANRRVRAVIESDTESSVTPTPAVARA